MSLIFDEQKRKTSQYQNWVITQHQLNGSAIDDVVMLNSVLFDRTIFRAGQWSREQCATTKKYHFQMHVRFRKPVVMATAKKHLDKVFGSPVSWMEYMKGTWQENLNYTSKEDTHVDGPYNFGVVDPSNFTRTVEYWFGPPGTGKSTAARKDLAAHGYDIFELTKGSASKGTWVSGYSGEEAAIMDEVDYNWFDDASWKKVLDRMPQLMAAGSGGRNVNWTPIHIILISNHPPDKFMANLALKSRFHRVKKFNNAPYPLPSPCVFDGCSEGDFDGKKKSK